MKARDEPLLVTSSAMFEILCLARELKTPKGDQIAGIIDDVIGVALEDPDT